MHKIYLPHTNGFSLDIGAQAKELELEPVKFEEIDSTYLGNFPTYNDLVLSAITSTKAKLNRTMAAFMRSLNKSLAGTNIQAGQRAEFYDDGGQSIEQVGVLLSKPRKAGLFAVMTAQIPCSDGQSVSIIFYAPDEDPLKITNDDTLVAFRFLLNKRDITHKVAPNQGKDISLAQTTQAIANLLERNSAKFRANLNKALASRKEFADKEDELERLQDELTRTLASISEIEKINTELTGRKAQLHKERQEVEQRFTGLQAKISDFKPVESVKLSVEQNIEAVKSSIEQLIVPELNQVIESAIKKGERATLPESLRQQLRNHYLSFAIDDEQLSANEQIAYLKYAYESTFADTAKNELENGGWINVGSTGGESEMESVQSLIEEHRKQILNIADELHQAHKGQGINNNAQIPEKLSDSMRDILGDMHSRGGREEVQSNNYGQDLYEAFMSSSAGEAYNHLRQSWASESPALSNFVANDDDVARGYEILDDLSGLDGLSALAADDGNAKRLGAIREIAENLDPQHPKAGAFYDAVNVTLKPYSERTSSNMSPAMTELKKHIAYSLDVQGEQLAERLRVVISSLEKVIAEQAKLEPASSDLPEELKQHLETLDKLAAGGFVVEEAVEQLNEVSEYLEQNAIWDSYSDKFDAAAELIADAIDARLEVNESAN